jgi:hypothetical protein
MGGGFVKGAGRGSRVVLLHGSVLAGKLRWRQQLPLTRRFWLEIVDQARYGRSHQVSPGEDLGRAVGWPGCWQAEHIWWATPPARWPRCWPPHCGPGRAVADARRTASLPPRPESAEAQQMATRHGRAPAAIRQRRGVAARLPSNHRPQPGHSRPATVSAGARGYGRSAAAHGKESFPSTG